VCPSVMLLPFLTVRGCLYFKAGECVSWLERYEQERTVLTV
jgi:hypothetical protein